FRRGHSPLPRDARSHGAKAHGRRDRRAHPVAFAQEVIRDGARWSVAQKEAESHDNLDADGLGAAADVADPLTPSLSPSGRGRPLSPPPRIIRSAEDYPCLLPGGEKVPEGRMRAGLRPRRPLTPSLSPSGRGRPLSPPPRVIPSAKAITVAFTPDLI